MDETTGCETLARVEQAFDELLACFDRTEDALFDCPVPVDLIRVMKDLRRVRHMVEEHAGDLRLAREVVGEDRPLASTFNRDGVPWPQTHETLSPRDLRLLSHRAEGLPADQLTAYRAEIGKETAPPLSKVPRRAAANGQADRNGGDEVRPGPNATAKPKLEVVPGRGDLTGVLSRLADGFKPDYGADPA